MRSMIAIKLWFVLQVLTFFAVRAVHRIPLSDSGIRNEESVSDSRQRAAFSRSDYSNAYSQVFGSNRSEKNKITPENHHSGITRGNRHSTVRRETETDSREVLQSHYQVNASTSRPTSTRTTSRPTSTRSTTSSPITSTETSTNRTSKRKPKARPSETFSVGTQYTTAASTSKRTTTLVPPRDLTTLDSAPAPLSGSSRGTHEMVNKPSRPNQSNIPAVREPSRITNNPQPPKALNDRPSSPSVYNVISCGDNITLTSTPQIIHSPGWVEGKKYPPNSDCTWKIAAPSKGAVIRIKIISLHIEDQVGCPYDFLEIKGQRKLCGYIANKEVLVNSSKLVITFKSDSNYEERGFEIEVISELPGCVSELRLLERGVITSPLYPNNYPDSIDCWTLLNAADSSQSDAINVTIILTFEMINLEPDEHCSYDFLEVYEVDNSTGKASKSLGKFCDKQEESTERKENGSGDLNPDPRLGSRQDKPIHPSLIIRSSGPMLMLHFHSDQLLNFKGYKATYMVDKSLQRSSGQNCNWSYDVSTQAITSPSYPSQYPPNKDCSIELSAPDDEHKIAVIFDTFHMEYDPNCSFDRLEIYDLNSREQEVYNSRALAPISNRTAAAAAGGDLLTLVQPTEPTRVLCGRKESRFKYLSLGQRIRLRFVSDDFAEYAGFSAKFTFIKVTQKDPYQPVMSRTSNAYFETTPSNATVTRGSSHLLKCKPKNYKPSENNTIIWFKNDREITEDVDEDGTGLLIREFGSNSVGRYTCKHGDHTADAWLEGQRSSCSLVFRKRPKDVTETEGNYMILECAAVITPERTNITVQWFKDGKLIANVSRLEVLKNNFLIFHDGLKVDDSGYYFCVARSDRHPNCALQAGARVTVRARANVEQICGKPKVGRPSKEKPSVNNHGKIVGGKNSEQGAFPWQVMFWDSSRKSFCGGALLNERWVATAAHCFTPSKGDSYTPPESHIEVRLGKYDQSMVEEHEVMTKIQTVVKHPNFNPDTFDNDLALVNLVDHISFTDYIKPICLGQNQRVIDDAFFKLGTLKMGHVTGWGQLKETGPQPRLLQELRVPIVDQNICKNSTSFKVTSNMFCAGYAQEIIGDACKGDSGGPFVGSAQERWYLLGIVSWGEGCGRTGKYGFYTKVSNYIDWMKGVIKS